MIKPTKLMNLHLTSFSYLPFYDRKIIDSFLRNHFLPNNPKKLVQNYQTNPKNIFGRKKRNVPITSTFGPIINLTNSS